MTTEESIRYPDPIDIHYIAVNYVIDNSDRHTVMRVNVIVGLSDQ